MEGGQGPGAPSKDIPSGKDSAGGAWTTLGTGNVNSSKTNKNKPNNERKLH